MNVLIALREHLAEAIDGTSVRFFIFILLTKWSLLSVLNTNPYEFEIVRG